MKETAAATRLVVSDVEDARTAILGEGDDWPDPATVDAAGIQLIVSALKSGVTPPEAVRNAPEVRRLWAALGLDDPADGPLSLDGALTGAVGG